MKENFFVWVVTGEKPCAALLNYMFTREGYAVTLLEDGLAAQKKINRETNPPHVILMNLSLPFVDGFQLMQQIQQKKGWQDAHIIALSPKNGEAYIAMPFQLCELLARVRHQLIL